MSSKFNEFRSTLSNLAGKLDLLKADFMDRESFKKFASELNSKLKSWREVCITGYFSEGMRKEFEKIAEWKKLRLICRKLDPKRTGDKKDLDALRKLSTIEPKGEGAGVEIKFSDIVHARLFVAFNRLPQTEDYSGLLILGSFDFNKDGIAGQRLDAGISTKNPDLIKSAIKLFEEMWNDSSSIPLDKAYPKETS